MTGRSIHHHPLEKASNQKNADLLAGCVGRGRTHCSTQRGRQITIITSLTADMRFYILCLMSVKQLTRAITGGVFITACMRDSVLK